MNGGGFTIPEYRLENLLTSIPNLLRNAISVYPAAYSAFTQPDRTLLFKFWFSSFDLDWRSLNLGNYRVYSIYMSGGLSFEVSVTKKRIEN
ncbi:hypothetical protein DTO164E3_7481 [Paecilomyces variotii]|nr:hypothetical protein DTO164E3_7481 [Paecilomyces variotii]KAJ9201520.1 hypothetical protein DTO032I3_4147 [Paecilomyces variotii]KAJ9275674.1 hypothetical protein DTO021D3_7494 [Paecilomyces variotii]KAJ9339956.1 hypothetical protein DTO027B6_7527 [Paecilomyces variotii]KAJ9377287.1 hypothetical protein DTO032I4_8204 [Paecilomyces variotii]